MTGLLQTAGLAAINPKLWLKKNQLIPKTCRRAKKMSTMSHACAEESQQFYPLFHRIVGPLRPILDASSRAQATLSTNWGNAIHAPPVGIGMAMSSGICRRAGTASIRLISKARPPGRCQLLRRGGAARNKRDERTIEAFRRCLRRLSSGDGRGRCFKLETGY